MFNSPERLKRLDETCMLCAQRFGDHSVHNECPTMKERKIVRHHFETTLFRGTGHYRERLKE